MILGVIPFPDIDPVAIAIGPLAIRWYALAYIAGFVLGWRWCVRLTRRPPHLVSPELFDNFLTWAIIGTILGGRLGYVLFYNLPHYLDNPLDALQVWHGGMSFHGGFLGVTIAMGLFARRHGVPFFALTDIVAAAAPIGLFFGRLANFVNGELWGRAADVPWAMVFPHAGPEPRHPSQLYEAGLEGLLLFAVLAACILVWNQLRRPGFVTGVFLIGYALGRIISEFFRQPDEQLGFLWGGATMGQLLSLPMLAVGIWLVIRAMRRRPLDMAGAA